MSVPLGGALAGLGAMTARLAEIQAVAHQLDNREQVTSPLFVWVSPAGKWGR